jgi:hypothetical protein
MIGAILEQSLFWKSFQILLLKINLEIGFFVKDLTLNPYLKN